MNMDLNNLLTIVFVGLIAGWIASNVMRKWKYGVVGYIVVGICGAFFGSFIFGLLGVHIAAGLLGSIITATIGAICILFLMKVLKI